MPINSPVPLATATPARPTVRLRSNSPHRVGSASQRRWLHPGAWWAWALLVAAAAGQTTNPLLLLLILAAVGLVVVSRRPDAPWSRSFAVLLRLGAIVVAFRVLMGVLLGAPQGNTVLFTLPTVGLPSWMSGLQFGGPVTLGTLLAAAYDGLRLAVVLACVGAANSLASPSRMLRAVPGALYEAGVAVVVTLTFTPSLIADLDRVRQARRLRGRPERGVGALRGAAMPVLESSLERSLDLAAAMDSRGYGRQSAQTPGSRKATSALVLIGMAGLGLGLFALLTPGIPTGSGWALLATGALLAGWGVRRAGRRSTRTRYRPDPWAIPEWLVTGAGLLTLAAFIVGSAMDPTGFATPTAPALPPALPLLGLLGVVTAMAPAWVAPRPPRALGRST